jgi:hypothetical protein
MSEPIYKVFMGRPSEAWYQLSEEERAPLLARLNAALAECGGERVVMCDSSWSSDHWIFFGVEKFPDLEAVQKYHAVLSEIDWFRYLDSITALGTQSG